MRFYDTLSRSVGEFSPLKAGPARIYTCGPTVYRRAHIGNLRTYIVADVLRRALESDGLEVHQVVNLTDVGHMTDEVGDSGEDRMLLAVEDEELLPEEIAEKYTEAFLRDTELVNIKPASLYPKATEHIEEMIEITQRLIERGHAYEVEGTVYYDVDSFPDYGKLSRNTLDKLRAGHRIEEIDPSKRHHYDFTLWRHAGERRLLWWESPWGRGYPGWHIECSAMSLKHLGEQFDIHTGGEDHIFPHHECEIAQSEGAVGHQVVQKWFHSYHLLVGGQRMAKSARNDYSLDDLEDRGYEPLDFRFLVLQTRYRHQENFSWDALDAAARGLARLRRQAAEWAALSGRHSPGLSGAGEELDRKFREAVGDDIDTPRALRVLYEVAGADLSPGEKLGLFRKWDRVLGLELDREAASGGELPPGAAERVEARERARSEGDFETADRLRAELAGMGVEVIDTPEGPRWLLKAE